MSGVHPCDFFSSPASRYNLVFSQPTTPLCGPPALVQSVLLASCAKFRCWVVKHVSISDHLPVCGSNIESWRVDSLSGRTFAEGCSEPSLQKSGSAAGRMRAVNHTRPFSSIIGL